MGSSCFRLYIREEVKENKVNSYIIIYSVIYNKIANLGWSYRGPNTIFFNNLDNNFRLVFTSIRAIELADS